MFFFMSLTIPIAFLNIFSSYVIKLIGVAFMESSVVLYLYVWWIDLGILIFSMFKCLFPCCRGDSAPIYLKIVQNFLFNTCSFIFTRSKFKQKSCYIFACFGWQFFGFVWIQFNFFVCVISCWFFFFLFPND